MTRSSKVRTPPAFVVPMAAQSVAELSEREGWIYELKLDGYRALLLKDRARVHIRSRNNKDLTACIRELRRLGCG